MFSTEVFLDAGEVSERPRRVMVDTGWLWAEVHFASDLFGVLLSQLPWQVMPSSVQLEVLLSLEALVAYLTDEPICRHESLRR